MMTKTRNTVSFTRPLLLAALIGVSVPVLQGCFPVVAAGAGTAVMSALDRRTSGTQVASVRPAAARRLSMARRQRRASREKRMPKRARGSGIGVMRWI